MPKSVTQAFQAMFPDPDFKKYQFNLLHKAVLGLIPLKIENAFEQYGLAIDEADSQGFTPLTWASLQGDFHNAKFLVNNGANVNTKTVDGNIPLMYAGAHGYLQCVELLLNHGANVNARNSSGWPVTYLVASSCHNDLKILKCLVSHQVNINILDLNKVSPLQVAAFYENPKIATKLISLGANVHAKDIAGINALANAVNYNAHQIIRQLLQCGADHTEQDERTWIPSPLDR